MTNEDETSIAWRCLTIGLGMAFFIGIMVLIAYGLFEFVEALAKS